jgi:hypothetical protein
MEDDMEHLSDSEHALLKRMTHKQRVMWWLTNRGTLTPLQAWTCLGIYGVKDTIYKLRRAGTRIDNTTAHAPNRFGKMCAFASYKLSAQQGARP